MGDSQLSLAPLYTKASDAEAEPAPADGLSCAQDSSVPIHVWKMPRHPLADGFVCWLLGLNEEDLDENEVLLHNSLRHGPSDPVVHRPTLDQRIDLLRRSLRSASGFVAIFVASVLTLRRVRRFNLHNGSAPTESAARVASFVHALFTTCAAAILAPALWSRRSALEFSSTLFSRRNSVAEARLACFSNGYFLYDTSVSYTHLTLPTTPYV